MRNIIESVPNFSEGRDSAQIQALIAVMNAVPGAAVLDWHSDADHNRSVITLAGEPQAVAEAALRGVGQAATWIDLKQHSGVHPRIGATDVLPFVPVQGWSLAQCSQLAHQVGQEIWDRYRIPVYFYGAAARHPDRISLRNVRSGEFEGLREAVLSLSGRAPDIGGPPLHSTAGAVAVGAREFLIACNVNLRGGNLEIAGKIARSVRASSGGLPGVQAMGVALQSRGMVQVSMNLTDFTKTSLGQLFDRVRREAESYGCTVVENEIVGLVPKRALAASEAGAYLNVKASQILENRIAALLPEDRVAKLRGGSDTTASATVSPAASNDRPDAGISTKGGR